MRAPHGAMRASSSAFLVLLAAAGCHGGAEKSATAPEAPAPSVFAPSVPTSTPIATSTSTPTSIATATTAAAPTDWCLPGLTPLAEDVCYVLPPLPADHPRRLLVYLHGIIPPVPDSQQQRKVEMTVLHACTRAGIAAIVPRGRRGLGPPFARDWWGWPTSAAGAAKLGPALITRWADAKRELEAIAGAPFDRTYLAGSSSGAYLIAALAIHGDVPSPVFPIDGFATITGGAAGADAAARLAQLSPRPFYDGYGTYDEKTNIGVHALLAALETAHWPVLAAPHPLGHGTNEVYLDEAFAFFDSQDANAPGRR